MNYDFIKIAKKYLSLLEEIEHAYLFGSVLVNSKEPNDIDVLIIYSKYSDTLHRQAQELAKALETNSGLPVDLTVLSVEEENEVQFLKRIKALQLK